ncbi:hypothetical protein AB9P05_20060 [Roseivirga sp. BDSF3-8]|uniref:hypothetical protein n=1 Tax=Roseivirga sp. BDSF3-8 TaxID=3241598 RepID=UPI003531D812
MSLLIEVLAKIILLVIGVLAVYRFSRHNRALRLTSVHYWLLIFFGIFTWMNWGGFHDEANNGSIVHEWDQYHYTISSKYFTELGYDGLYVATAEAAREEGGHEPPRIRDLRSGYVVDAPALAAHQQEVRSRFGEARWAAFKRDLEEFEVNPSVYLDHGYNAPPTLTAILRILTTAIPVNGMSKVFYALLDIVFILAAILMIRWAFGMNAAAQCALLFGISFLARYFWNGGSILRYDWFFAITSAVCLLRKDRLILAGIALCYACAIRVFPVYLALPVFAYFLVNGKEHGVKSAVRFGTAMAASGTILVLFGVLNNGRGTDAYYQLYEKLSLHDNIPPPNNVGVKTFFITSSENMKGELVNEHSIYETNTITEDIIEKAKSNTIWIYLFQFLFAGLSIWLGTRAGDASTALMVGFVGVFGATALTCYYWATLALLPLLSISHGLRIGLVANLAMYLWAAVALFLPVLGVVDKFNGALVFVPCAAIILWALVRTSQLAVFNEPGDMAMVFSPRKDSKLA